MTQEEKQLLLKDICARLPYGVLILDTAAEKYGKLYQINNSDSVWYDCQETEGVECQTVFNIKPYLHPMSSMTDEERKEYRKECNKVLLMRYRINHHYPVTDWLIAHHFDYRGLIPKGLALEAPVDMYKNE